MRKVLILLAFILLVGSAFAYDLNACQGDGNFTKIGECIIHGSFSGSTVLMAFIMMIIFSVFMWQAKVPMGAALGLGLILVFALLSWLPSGIGLFMINLAILAIGVLVGLAILHFVRR